MDVEKIVGRALSDAVAREVEAKLEARLAPLRAHVETLRAKAARFTDATVRGVLLTRLDEAQRCLGFVEAPRPVQQPCPEPTASTLEEPLTDEAARSS